MGQINRSLILFTIILSVFLKFHLVFGILKCNYIEESSATNMASICELREITIPSNHQNVIDVANRSKEAISGLHVFNSKMDFIPNLIKIAFPKLEKIYLSRTETAEVLDSTFIRSRFDHIKSFELDGFSVSFSGKVQKIENRTFEKFPNLMELMITDQLISELNGKSFEANPNLTVVLMKGNRLSGELPEDLFENQMDLKFVNFMSNFIESLPDGIFSNSQKLESINFRNNWIKKINPSVFENLAELQEVDFGMNRLETLDGGLFSSNVNLTSITLDHNHITHIPDNFLRGLEALEVLNLKSNFLEHLDDELFNETVSIKKLYFMDNQIRKIHQNLLSNLEHLEVLQLENNLIEIITVDTFTNNKNLKFLRLNDNRISRISQSNLKDFLRLKELDLRNNQCIDKHFSIWGFEKYLKRRLVNYTLWECFSNWEDSRISIQELKTVCGQKPEEESNSSSENLPWMMTLLNRENPICGGNLISSKHVLLAAHCIQNKNVEGPLLPSESKFIIGKFKFASDATATNWTEYEVENFVVHPKWDPQQVRYDADIALGVLKDDVDFSDQVRPVCLNSISNVKNMDGFWSSWTSPDEEISAHVINDVTCLYSNPQIYYIFPLNTSFCVGNIDGRGLCNSGGFYLEQNNTWSLAGIKSASAQTNGTCDLNSYPIFTDVEKYLNWIEEEILNP